MINETDKIRHFLANLLTVLTIDVSESRLPRYKKKQCNDFFKTIALLTIHQEILLGKKPAFFKQDVSLFFILDLLSHSLDLKFNFLIPKSDSIINVDKGYFLESLRDIVKYLLLFVLKVEFKYDEDEKLLSIVYAGRDIEELGAMDPMNCLKIENISNGVIPYQLALKTLQMHGTAVKIEKNKICIYL